MAKQILLIEDERWTVESLIEQLEREGEYVVDVGKDTTEGVRLLSEKRYDVLLLDIMLPHGDEIDQTVSPKRSGIILMPMVRKGKVGKVDVSQNANVPLIVLTAISSYPKLQEIKDLKPHVILRKPVTYKDFRIAVKAVLSQPVSKEIQADEG